MRPPFLYMAFLLIVRRRELFSTNTQAQLRKLECCETIQETHVEIHPIVKLLQAFVACNFEACGKW